MEAGDAPRGRRAPVARERTRRPEARLGISPICWWNDGLAELSDDVSLDECLRQAAEAGCAGVETGRRFPMSMAELGPVLDRHGMSVCGGWFSGTVLEGDLEENKDRIRPQMDLFIAAGAPCIVYGEVARSIQGDRSRSLAEKPRLSDDEMRLHARRTTGFGEWCANQGMPLAYHHHMAAVVETEAGLDLFVAHSGEGIPLLYDAGHMAMARATCSARSTSTTPASPMSTPRTCGSG